MSDSKEQIHKAIRQIIGCYAKQRKIVQKQKHSKDVQSSTHKTESTELQEEETIKGLEVLQKQFASMLKRLKKRG